jgi:hypothetical protein
MNLKEFINHRFVCPLCQIPLAMSFHSKKWQNIKYERDRLVVTFRMDKMNRSQKPYKINYSFGLNDSSFYIDFLSKEEKLFETEVPNFLRDRFKELDKNLKSYYFYKHCDSCNCFMYASNSFKLDYRNTSIGDLTITHEEFGFSKPNSDGYKIYKLINRPDKSESHLVYGKSSSDIFARTDSATSSMEYISVPLIRFTSKEETLHRIQKLVIFS